MMHMYCCIKSISSTSIKVISKRKKKWQKLYEKKKKGVIKEKNEHNEW